MAAKKDNLSEKDKDNISEKDNADIINDEEVTAETKENSIDYEEYVTVRLFKDKDKYKDDVFVAVNGESCLIRRGEEVKIKRKFAEVLLNSDKQDEYAAQLMEEYQEQYSNAQKVLN